MASIMAVKISGWGHSEQEINIFSGTCETRTSYLQYSSSALPTTMAFNLLPKEILQNIIPHRPPNYSLLCRNICDVATAVAYRDIDFTIHERGDMDANKKLVRRQVKLLASIASYISLAPSKTY
jgi:hypothetical protein